MVKHYLNNISVIGCFCPLLEWLHLQNIDFINFSDHIFNWLMLEDKKNTLLFLGVADSGKSHIARLIWSLFLLNKRIVQDGIFTFANLINAGCGLWDEPFIAPDMADTTKLILEGCEDVQVAIKNKGSIRLSKKVPIIITSNHSLSRYCSADECFTFKTNNVLSNSKFCKCNEHYCIFLDETNSEYSPISGSQKLSNKRQRTIAKGSETGISYCSGAHKLKEQHILTFIIYTLVSNIDNIDFNELYTLLKDNDTTILNSFCHFSNKPVSFVEEYENVTGRSYN